MAHDDETRDLIDLVDFELARAEAKDRHAGWSTWAFLASLASVLWLLSDQWPHLSESNPHRVGLLFLAATFFASSAQSLIGSLTLRDVRPLASDSQSDVRVMPASAALHRIIPRPAALFLLAEMATSIWIAQRLSVRELGIIAYWGILVSQSLGFVVLAFALVLSFFQRPATVGSPNRPWHLIAVTIIGGVPLVIVVKLILRVFADWRFLSVFDIRIAGLLAVGVVLTERLLSSDSASALVATLTSIREDVSFGRTPVDQSRQRLIAVLFGEDVEPHLKDAVAQLNRIRELLASGLPILQELSELLATTRSASGPLTSEQSQLIVDTITRAMAHAVDIKPTVDILVAEHRRVAKILGRFSAHQRARQVQTDIEQELRALGVQQSSLRKETEALTAIAEKSSSNQLRKF